MKRLYILIMCTVSLLLGCSEDLSLSEKIYGTGEEINLTAGYQTLTRVTDVGFTDGDRMGIYIVDYANDRPQGLSAEKLHASNVLFTYDENENKWNGATKLYWNDKTTPVDIYGYYPFDAALTSPTDYSFSVKTNQNTSGTDAMKGGYEASDLLWAKAKGVRPTSDVIQLTYSHVMAGVTIRVIEGSGFASGEWAAAKKMVWLNNVAVEAKVNLEDATTEVASDKVERIIPLEYNNEYRAVVIPQTIAAGKEIVGLTVNGENYSLKKDVLMTFVSKKMHNFTIKVDKKTSTGDYVFSLVDESITKWIDDEEFHDGLVREYVVVNVETPGTLKQVLKDMGLDPEAVESMKLTGTINAADREFIGRNMPSLTNLNAKDVIMEDKTIAFPGEGHITHIVYPKEHLKTIGYMGPLVGSQIIPEGVEVIQGGAYYGTLLYSGVEFPSTLKELHGAFSLCTYSGEIHLPEGLEIIGDGAWGHGGVYDNPNITGALIIPQSVRHIGRNAFNGNFSGDLIIPQGIKKISEDAFGRSHFTGNLIIPEGCEEVESAAFGNGYLRVGFKGELVLPSSLKRIGRGAFSNNDFSKVILPKDLIYIGPSAFYGCNRLSGTISLPKNILAIQDEVFKGCSMLTGIELHKDITYIGAQAFAGCSHVTSIICHAEEPPMFEDNTFEGLSLGDIIVEVPAASVPLYQQDSRWKRFKRITAYSNFLCRPRTACALNTAREQVITLNADGAWTLTHKPDWCKVSQTSGTGKTSLTVSIDQMARGNGNREGYIEFKLNNQNFTTRCDITQYDYEYNDDQLITLQRHTRGRGIKVLMIGDGWDGEKISDGSYMQLCRDNMEYFFGLPPYDRLRDYFDVYAAISLSQENGVNTPNTYLDTRFGTMYGGGGELAMSNLLPDDELIFPYVKELGFTDEDLWRGVIIMIPNTTDYNGGTYFFGDRPVCVCPPSGNPYPSDTRGVIQHEACGHGFGKLGDENIQRNAFAPNQVKGYVNEMHSRGWYMNLASTGKMNDVPWASYIFDERYSDKVDIFEGGLGYTRGIFRSESNSCMNNGIPYFNAISRETIVRRVMDAAGEQFSMEDFYKNDTQRWGATASTRSAENSEKAIVNHRPPVLVKGNEIRNRLKELRVKQQRQQ